MKTIKINRGDWSGRTAEITYDEEDLSFELFGEAYRLERWNEEQGEMIFRLLGASWDHSLASVYVETNVDAKGEFWAFTAAMGVSRDAYAKDKFEAAVAAAAKLIFNIV